MACSGPVGLGAKGRGRPALEKSLRVKGTGTGCSWPIGRTDGAQPLATHAEDSVLLPDRRCQR